MKVGDLIKLLEQMPQDDEVKVSERYSEGYRQVTIVRKEYETLDKTYCYIG